MGKVGLMGLRPPGSNWETTKELAILAEELGYDNITMGESLAEDAFTSLAQISAVTKKIRIGTSLAMMKHGSENIIAPDGKLYAHLNYL